MTYKHNDQRRIDMKREGFLVRVIIVDRESHKITFVKYVYDPRSESEREAAEQAEYEAFMAQKKASGGEPLA